jgi:hypothetical protein
VIDFALGLVLFAVCLACAGCGVALSLMAVQEEKALAFRVGAIGITSFVAYTLLHPYVPRLV